MVSALESVGYKWYAEYPSGFAIKNQSKKRLILITLIVLILLGALFFTYLIILRNMPVPVAPKKEKIVMTAESIPSTPTEVRKKEKSSSSAGASSQSNLSASDSRELTQETEQQLVSALEGATAGLLAELSSGLPSAKGIGQGGILEGFGSGADIVSGSSQGLGGFGSGGLGSGNLESVIAGLGGGKGKISIGGPGKVKVGVGRGKLGVKKRGAKFAVRIDLQDLKVGSGGRGSAEISKVVAGKKTAIQKCYKEAREIDGSFEGRMTILISILPNGNVRDVRIVRASFKSDILNRCIQKIFRRMKFSTISKSTLQNVQVPYDFKLGV